MNNASLGFCKVGQQLGFAVLLSLATLCFATGAEQSRFPNSEDLRHIKGLGGPSLSPDGQEVLFTITDATADGAKSHLWLVAVAGGAARQLTFSPAADKRGERGAVWAPDGSAIFFLAKRGETMQLFRLPMAGGEASPYDLKVLPAVDDSKEPGFIPPVKSGDTKETEAKESKEGKQESKKEGKQDKDEKVEPIAINVGGFAFSPDSRWLAVWATDPETPGEKKAKDAKADAVWVNHERHGERLYLAALKPDGTLDGALKPAGLAPDVQVASWSPKSDRLIVVTEQPNEASDLGPAAATWLISPTALDKPIALKAIPATVRPSFAWREDGSEIVFAAQTPEDAPPGVEELFALALPDAGSEEKAKPVRLMAGFQGSLGYGDPVFLADGKVLASAAMGTKLGSIRIALDGKVAPETLAQETPVIANLVTNRKQTGWVWLASGSDHPTSLCYSASLGEDCKTLTTPELTTEHFRSVNSKLVQWKSDGLTIEGLLYLPPEAETKKVPLIVDVHGGPLGAWEDRHMEWDGFVLSHGWAILRPNPRGSSAYGVKFAAANKNDLGGGDFRDVMAGVDEVVKQFPIDPDKLALMGYSYGGEMAGFAEGKTDRFKAIISGAPVIDQFSEYGTERGSWYDRWYFGKPWEHFEDAWRQSALSGVSKAKTPFLLLQGEADVTDPVGQSEEMYRALRQAGVPVEMVTYPREDHGPLANGIFGNPVPEPWHGFDGRQRIVEFLQKGFGEASK
jgi:dipeptidyl aminopeptidase/acylaminoacyl peptidase